MTADERFTCVVELPRGTRELSGTLPVHRGFFRDTMLPDGGALEALIAGDAAAVPGTALEVRAVALARTAGGLRILATTDEAPGAALREQIEAMFGAVAWEGPDAAAAAVHEALAHFALASIGPA